MTAPGTGLGMSIVKQIVDLAGGKIDVTSEKGKGTKVVLSLPLEDCVDPQSSSEDIIAAVRRRTAGQTVTIRGFDSAFNTSDLEKKASADLKASLEKYATDWFQLTIVAQSENADIAICDESQFLGPCTTQGEFRALLILCSNRSTRAICTPESRPGQMVELVSKPCGPHRLATALLNCLDPEDTTRHIQVGSTGAETTQISGPDSDFSNNLDMTTRKSSRLIGDFQASIGFSPATSRRGTGSVKDVKVPASTSRIRPLSRRKLEALQASMRKSDLSDSSGILRNPSDVTSTTSTSLSSAGNVDNAQPTAFMDGDATPKPVVRPRMLLVEVCETHWNQTQL